MSRMGGFRRQFFPFRPGSLVPNRRPLNSLIGSYPGVSFRCVLALSSSVAILSSPVYLLFFFSLRSVLVSSAQLRRAVSSLSAPPFVLCVTWRSNSAHFFVHSLRCPRWYVSARLCFDDAIRFSRGFSRGPPMTGAAGAPASLRRMCAFVSSFPSAPQRLFSVNKHRPVFSQIRLWRPSCPRARTYLAQQNTRTSASFGCLQCCVFCTVPLF